MRTTRAFGPAVSRVAAPVTGLQQGMVAPQDAFVNAGGQLNATSFAFLYSVFSQAKDLLAQVQQAQADIATATSGVTTLQAQVNQILSEEASEPNSLANLQAQITTLQGQTTSLQSQVDTINQRLGAAGIP